MLCLGIESTAHTFSCAVIEKKQKKGKILSDIRSLYNPQVTYREPSIILDFQS